MTRIWVKSFPILSFLFLCFVSLPTPLFPQHPVTLILGKWGMEFPVQQRLTGLWSLLTSWARRALGSALGSRTTKPAQNKPEPHSETVVSTWRLRKGTDEGVYAAQAILGHWQVSLIETLHKHWDTMALNPVFIRKSEWKRFPNILRTIELLKNYNILYFPKFTCPRVTDVLYDI